MKTSKIPPKAELLPYISDRIAAAEKFGVSEKTVLRWLKQHGIYKPIRNCGPNKLDMDKAREMRALSRQGMTVQELAIKYGVTVTTVSRVLYGITYREPKEVAVVSVIYNHVSNLGGCES